MTWDSNPKAWDTVTISELPLTGVWEVEPVNGTARNVRAKRSKGKDGAKLKDHGLDEATLRITGRITSEMWETAIIEMQFLLPPIEGGEQAPHTISHPMCAAMRIDKIYILGIKLHPPDRGIMKIEINAKKWVKEVADAKTTDKFANKGAVSGDQYERIADKYAPPNTATGSPINQTLADPNSAAAPFLGQSN